MIEFSLKKLQQKRYTADAFKNYKELKERGALRHEGKKIILDTRLLTEEEKKDIIESMKRERIRTLKRTLIRCSIVLVVLAIATVFFLHVREQAIKEKKISEERLKRLELEKISLKKQEELQALYPFFIQEAQSCFKKGQYHNSIFQYKEALKAYPDDKVAATGLARAYIYNCWIKNEKCELAATFLNEMKSNIYPADFTTLSDTLRKLQSGELSLP